MSLLSTIGLSAAVLWFFRGTQDNSQEINWQQFATHLLAKGEVERIVIVNKQTAKVVLRHDASIDSISRAGGRGSTSGSSGQQDRPFMNMDDRRKPSSVNGATAALVDHRPRIHGTTRRAIPQARRRRHRQGTLVRGQSPANLPQYYSRKRRKLRRKLEVCQRELGIDTKDFVPVQYANQTSWGSELMKLAPTLVLVGLWVFMMARMNGGGIGGGGADRAIFSKLASRTRKIYTGYE